MSLRDLTYIEISSDDNEEEEDQHKSKVYEVFEEFLKKCELLQISEETSNRARELFYQTKKEFVNNDIFLTVLGQYMEIITRENVKKTINVVVDCLFKEDFTVMTQKCDQVANSNEHMEKQCNKSEGMLNINHAEMEINTLNHDDIIMLDAESSSNLHSCECTANKMANQKVKNETRIVAKKNANCSQEAPVKKKRTRKEMVRDLKKRLECYAKEIKRLQTCELSLEELDHADSSYLKEAKLKEKFTNVYKKLCKLEGLNGPLKGKYSEQKISIVGSPYPEINREAEVFIRKNDRSVFPDFFDIRDIVRKANARYSIGLKQNEEEDCAREVFCEIGDKMQRRRKKEFTRYSGSFLTDSAFHGDDPAEYDNELRKKLKRNKKISQQNIDNVFRKYLQLQFTGCANESSSDDEQICKKVKKTHDKISPISNKTVNQLCDKFYDDNTLGRHSISTTISTRHDDEDENSLSSTPSKKICPGVKPSFVKCLSKDKEAIKTNHEKSQRLSDTIVNRTHKAKDTQKWFGDLKNNMTDKHGKSGSTESLQVAAVSELSKVSSLQVAAVSELSKVSTFSEQLHGKTVHQNSSTFHEKKQGNLSIIVIDSDED
eukprot:gene15986-17596_t